ncbi:MAG: hypothetical protein A3J55_03530 [Candidatus Ryanbacteria bacterium RIFCSPHIGHO2_02_FULL_45_17b]|uniref:Transcription regulator TrmB N-terminal domain-containing protein n=1 Tax=Candidatus Ryanbacteria bacterium RIFCSPHIGHO2_01_FULL_45_22 TaxID=1802114 RepID=A0A1G2G355_9BACT|nr:MAG: hypothetical protein A2719_04730 [Candidatus Ryanbacteria bacterium RIFCSPHIGHO2_01_FULL_45_22]OGZ47531.1 MAG: hypothetical protein A3J55_03530 [Candidatus Ryanbacteria bacterium RIFCSPHIGHO2_02_FULL_45_17b]
MNDFTNILQACGFSEDEARVYKATLELGADSITHIAQKAGIKRPKAYYVMDGLIKKGVIIKQPKNKRMLFSAKPPRKILGILRSKEAELEKALPYMESLYKTASGRPRVQFFEGREGIKNAYSEIFATHRTLLGIASMTNVYEHFSREGNKDFFALLRQSGGQMRDIVDDSPEGRQYAKEEYRKGLGQTKFLPADFKIETDVLIDGPRVLFVSYSTLVAVLIEDERIAETQRKLIEFLWKHVST